jgi:N6-L-threonylcarbamoyladenine synthase
MSLSGDLILGIETSCDDTSVALVDRHGGVMVCETVSQYAIHAEYGGVYPELAGRAHLQAILPTVDIALTAISGDLDRILAIGVTRGPGLIGSLLIGVNTAQALGLAWSKPVVGVNHLRGHLRSPDLEEKRVEYPAVLLLISGGHTFICFMRSNTDFEVLGGTRDDSVGESYDKVARMLDLGMPGGPAVDRAASGGSPIYEFPRPLINVGYEFSFSGLKSSVARLIEKNQFVSKNDVSSSFVASCLEIIGAKLSRAIDEFSPKSVVVVGGVAASLQVRELVEGICVKHQIKACLPPRKWATDNAAMIALAAWDYVAEEVLPDLNADPNLSFTDW